MTCRGKRSFGGKHSRQWQYDIFYQLSKRDRSKKTIGCETEHILEEKLMLTLILQMYHSKLR